jgi:hypothetical protein
MTFYIVQVMRAGRMTTTYTAGTEQEAKVLAAWLVEEGEGEHAAVNEANYLYSYARTVPFLSNN